MKIENTRHVVGGSWDCPKNVVHMRIEPAKIDNNASSGRLSLLFVLFCDHIRRSRLGLFVFKFLELMVGGSQSDSPKPNRSQRTLHTSLINCV